MKPVFKSYRTFYNYLLSGRKLRCNKLVYKYTNNCLYLYDSPTNSWKNSQSESLHSFCKYWYTSHNIEKVKNNKHLLNLLKDGIIW